MSRVSRRGFMQTTAVAGLGFGVGAQSTSAHAVPAVEAGKIKLGMVTYMMGAEMTCEQLIAFCKQTGLTGVELRTTHKHGVEPTLSPEDRARVRGLFADGAVDIVGLGTTCEFHSKEEAKVLQNIEDGKKFAQLAKDVGAPSIKIRPNGLYDDEPHEKTIERIALAWRELADFAAGLGVETRMEVHGGKGSAEPANIRKMIDVAKHANTKVCWNSNTGEQDENGSIKANFELLKDYIGQVHITEIGVYQYPWQELFDLLAGIGFSGYCLAEIGVNPEPERFMKYYRTLFDLYTHQYTYPKPGMPVPKPKG